MIIPIRPPSGRVRWFPCHERLTSLDCSAHMVSSGAKWRILWMLWFMVIIFAVTIGTDFVGHSHWDGVRWVPFEDTAFSLCLFDILANLLLFIPFGYFSAKLFSTRQRFVVLCVAVGAMLFSVGAEVYQVFSHGTRVASITDVCNDALGAAIGAAMTKVLVKRGFRETEAFQWILSRF
jgi:glycopeptide antibiotics resistance protein